MINIQTLHYLIIFITSFLTGSIVASFILFRTVKKLFKKYEEVKNIRNNVGLTRDRDMLKDLRVGELFYNIEEKEQQVWNGKEWLCVYKVSE